MLPLFGGGSMAVSLRSVMTLTVRGEGVPTGEYPL